LEQVAEGALPNERNRLLQELNRFSP